MPHDLTASTPFLHLGALSTALAAALGIKSHGARCVWNDTTKVPSTWTPGPDPLNPSAGAVQNFGTCFLSMDDTAQPADDTAALNLAAAHDPVFLSADKTTIQANGTDLATITVNAPKSGAAPVTVVCTPTAGPQVTEAVPLVAGVGTMQFKSSVQGSYTLTVQNPSNRSTDALVITAV